MLGKLRVSTHGVVGVILIIIMFIVAAIVGWNAIVWYFIFSLLLYGVAIIGITLKEDAYKEEQRLQMQRGAPTKDYAKIYFNIWRVFIGTHCAFLLLIVTLIVVNRVFNSGDQSTNEEIAIGLFVASVGAGMAIPFMLFRSP